MADRVCQFLSNTTVVADFDADNDYYFINESGRRWQPNVARRRRGQMGNRPRFEDVDEEIPISITGSSVSAIVGRETALVNLIDQAQRKFDGEGVEAVTWKYRLQDSTLAAALQVGIVGYPSSGPVLVYEGEYEETGLTSAPFKRDMVFRFARRGELLGAEESDDSGAVTLPAKMTCTFGTEVETASPVDLSLVASDATNTSSGSKEAFIFFSGQADNIIKLEAESGDTLTQFSSHADTTASGDAVAQASADITTKRIKFDSVGINSNARRFQFYALLDNSDVGTTYDARVQVFAPGTSTVIAETPRVRIEDGVVATQGIYFGELALNQPLVDVRFDFGSPSEDPSVGLEVDYFVIVAVDNDVTTIGSIDVFNSITNNADLAFTHRLLTHPTPLYINYLDHTATKTVPSIYHGDKMFYMRGDTAEFLIMSWGSSSWGLDEGYTLTATRRPAYLVPQ